MGTVVESGGFRGHNGNATRNLLETHNHFVESTYRPKMQWMIPEPHYKLIPKQVIYEEYLGDVVDYKLHTIHGKIELIQISYFENKEKVFFYFTADFQPAPHLYVSKRKTTKAFPVPKSYPIMKRFCQEFYEKEKFPYVRIDLYDINGVAYFSEFTFTPAALKLQFRPEYNYKFHELFQA